MFYIGIDFGATNVRAAMYDEKTKNMSKIIKRSLVREENVTDEIEKNIIQIFEQLCKEYNKEQTKLGGIGIAMAALFDRTTGIITSWPNNNKYRGFPFRSYLQEYFNVPVVLEDDANAAALGEQLVGVGNGLKDFMYVTVSTGIGSGIIVNNTLLTGAHGWAGELGHIKVTDCDVRCTCGAKGCLQSVASGPALVREFKRLSCYEKYFKGREIILSEVVSLAIQGEEEVKALFTRAGTYIGNAFANLVMVLDIPLIVIGGGVSEAGDLLIDPIIKSVNDSLQNRRKVKIVLSNLNNKNGVIGAVNLITKYCNES